MTEDSLTLALPRGRIAGEALPLLARAGIVPEAAFGDPASRQLVFATSRPGLRLVRVRAFDVVTFVAFGAAQLGVCGLDVLEEFACSGICRPVDLGIGRCRLVLAAGGRAGDGHDGNPGGEIRVATKYPVLTTGHFAALGVQAECISLNGAVELAPALGMCDHIVDLVSTGETLRANGLREIRTLREISSWLIVNRIALRTMPARIGGWIGRFREVAGDD